MIKRLISWESFPNCIDNSWKHWIEKKYKQLFIQYFLSSIVNMKDFSIRKFYKLKFILLFFILILIATTLTTRIKQI